MSVARYAHAKSSTTKAPPRAPSARAAPGSDKLDAARASRSLWRILCRPSAPQTLLTTTGPGAAKLPLSARANEKPKEAVPENQLIEDSLTQTQRASWTAADSDETNNVVSQIVANPGLMLSGEQKAVLQAVLYGEKNMFFTGAAGTGKSVLLRCIIAQLRARYRRDEIAVTALTGIAACNIGGMTLHRFAGIGLGQDTVENHIKQIQRNQRSMRRWQSVKVLLVDEVSMLRADLLEKLEAIARGVRGNNIKFGGIQLVFTGDLFQLPPVPERYGQGAGAEQQYCFESLAWGGLIDRTVNLTRVFRQADPKFARVLNELRVGVVHPDTAELFRSLVRPPKMPKGIVPTKLFPRRKDVTTANQQALERLDGTVYEYDCFDEVTEDGRRENVNLNLTSMAEERVNLKLGAQVMMIKNIDDTIVNGSIGKIVAFMSAEDMGIKERRTDHDIDFENSGDEAEPYAADVLGAYGDSEPAQRKRRLAESLSMQQASANVVWPVVRFNTREGTIRYMMVRPETWSVTDSQDRVIASRTQIPLLLAWALSIHKAQGQTLPYVSVNLQHIFEKGQAYVAISRATCLEGLQIHRFSERSVMVDSKVLDFYKGLEQVSDDEIAQAEAYFESKVPNVEVKPTKASAKAVPAVSTIDSVAETGSSQPLPRKPRRKKGPVKRDRETGMDDFFLSDDVSSDVSWVPQSDTSEMFHSSDDFVVLGSVVHTDSHFEPTVKRARTQHDQMHGLI